MSSLQSESTAVNQRNLVLFVIEDFESQLKLSSSSQHKNEFEEYNKNNRATSHLYEQAPYSKLFTMNQNILNEIENETRRIATSVDSITENLSAILHSASALTVCCLETYKDAVCKTCDQINDNIKSVYQLIAKCEELSREMDVFYKIAEKINGEWCTNVEKGAGVEKGCLTIEGGNHALAEFIISGERLVSKAASESAKILELFD